ncbi:hypothetical protein BVRB_034750 [Beta vulgaris subsp. vulgaris]|uniref:Uncharacterized protein n=1 Tax=Beta vulgaris subsp. vulgaris TaxID=3555 RepID=A0A0J7YQY3_BETVV|nr:hypothetical protein BVRB_034750 [Beta vulgaris subsp. vulgaris]
MIQVRRLGHDHVCSQTWLDHVQWDDVVLVPEISIVVADGISMQQLDQSRKDNSCETCGTLLDNSNIGILNGRLYIALLMPESKAHAAAFGSFLWHLNEVLEGLGMPFQQCLMTTGNTK